MSTGAHRAVELLVGIALVGYGGFAICAGRILGKFRIYTRGEDPWSFWATVLISFGIGAVFLLGYVSWRN